MAQRLRVTSGKQWRERVRGGVVLRFPSGFVGRVRGVQPDALLTSGKIPDQLTPLIAALMDGRADLEAPETIEALKAQTALVDAVCRSALVDPRIVDDPQADDEIGIGDLEWPDKQFLMGVLGATTRGLELFRDKQERNVVSVGSAEGHDAPGQPDTEAEAVGPGDERV